MVTAVIIAGAIAEFTGWWLVSARGALVWRVMPVVLGAMGMAAVLVEAPVWTTGPSGPRALFVGVAAGLALYAATRVFVWGASRWTPFRRDVVEKYGQAGEVTLARSLVLSLGIMVPAEELFWRGLVQGRLDEVTTTAAAAIGAWIVYLGVNSASRSLPIVAGAVVGGAVWASLAWWSGGVLASLASHILWTGMMLALPPGVGRPAIEGGPAR
jgi:membrane protease YdiL (CAAX protease family)